MTTETPRKKKASCPFHNISEGEGQVLLIQGTWWIPFHEFDATSKHLNRKELQLQRSSVNDSFFLAEMLNAIFSSEGGEIVAGEESSASSATSVVVAQFHVTRVRPLWSSYKRYVTYLKKICKDPPSNPSNPPPQRSNHPLILPILILLSRCL